MGLLLFNNMKAIDQLQQLYRKPIATTSGAIHKAKFNFKNRIGINSNLINKSQLNDPCCYNYN